MYFVVNDFERIFSIFSFSFSLQKKRLSEIIKILINVLRFYWNFEF